VKFRTLVIVAAPLAGALLARPALAQQEFLRPAAAKKDCKLLCAPKFSISPSIQVTNVFDSPRVRSLEDGSVRELESKENFILFFTTVIPTAIPRTSLEMQIGWTPWADRDSNPFTGFTADDLNEEDIDANEVVIDMGVNLELVRMKDTNGWFGLTFEVLDNFGPARQPEDERTYTHKLNLELDANFGIFNWLPKKNPLSNVTAYAELDYTATGLPEEGDEVPKGKRVFLEDASPWTFFAGLTLPIAPLP
jgi:hypothetical protein